MDYNILLIGFMGTGKTTVSKELSKEMLVPEVDMDACLVEKANMSISDIFDQYGEEYFRDMETECVKELQQQGGKIISCGGGAVLREQNVEYMKENGVIVLLTAKPETILKRVKNSTERPILNGNMNLEFITRLMDRRKDRYREVADVIIETDDKDIAQISREIQKKVESFIVEKGKKDNNC